MNSLTGQQHVDQSETAKNINFFSQTPGGANMVQRHGIHLSKKDDPGKMGNTLVCKGSKIRDFGLLLIIRHD